MSEHFKHLQKTKDLFTQIVRRVENDSVLIFSHFGNFDESKVEWIVNTVKNRIIDSGSEHKNLKKLCRILIEIIQNISIHGQKDVDGKQNAFLIVSKTKGVYTIFSGNLIKLELMDDMKSKMQLLSSLNTDEIDDLYIKTLSNDSFSQKGGAGLGLLTMVRKSRLCQYKFDKVDDLFGVFELKIEFE